MAAIHAALKSVPVVSHVFAIPLWLPATPVPAPSDDQVSEMIPSHPSGQPSRGFMLLEVLISVLIFSVGVLALVGLQASMTRGQTESKVRADASYLANEMVGLIWSDTTNIAQYNGSSCAGYDPCKAWQLKVQRALPSATPTVAVITSAGSTQGNVTITITWTSTNGDAHKFQTETSVRTAGDT
jgi:type IV pilus assembly protein PilV